MLRHNTTISVAVSNGVVNKIIENCDETILFKSNYNPH